MAVDLDGSFLLVDSLARLRLRLLTRKPHRFLALRRRRRQGKDAAKIFLWEHGGLQVADLPVNQPLLDWLTSQRAAGRQVVLATGSADGLAQAVAAAYPVFTDAMGTRPGLNLTGPRKAAALVERFGERGFDYAGDDEADLAVWAHARKAVLCGVTDEVRRAVAELCPVALDLPAPRRRPLLVRSTRR